MKSVKQIKAQYGIVGHDQRLEHAIFTAMQVAQTDASALIHGESGTGKEVFSKIIHQYSKRKHNTCIALNCGAIPEGTIDSELFGHEKGAFTGAYEARKGYFEVANKGTLFLDEIGEMPLPTQARLLRVLETGEFIRVGSSSVQRTDVRVIAATNVDLLQHIEANKFRADLYYRLNTVPIYLPPLRARGKDVVLLFIKFVSDFAERYGSPVLALSAEAEVLLQKAYFPGNIRQLKNLAEQLSLLEPHGKIEADTLLKYLPKDHHLPVLVGDQEGAQQEDQMDRIAYNVREIRELLLRVLGLREASRETSPRALPTPDRGALDRLDRIDHLDRIERGRETSTVDTVKTLELPPSSNHEPELGETTEVLPSLEEMEKKMIEQTLEACQYRRKDAADMLKISERTLYRKIKRYGL